MAGEGREERGGVFTESANTLMPMKEDYLGFLFLFLYLQASDQNNDFGTGI